MSSDIVNPVLTTLWQSFPHWRLAWPWHEIGAVSSAQLFAGLDFLLITYAMVVVLYLERARGTAYGGKGSFRRVLWNTLIGGPGLTFANEMAILFRQKGLDGQRRVGKSKVI